MDDEQLQALKKNGGVIQAVAFASYVKCDPVPPERNAAIAALRKEFGLPEVGGGAEARRWGRRTRSGWRRSGGRRRTRSRGGAVRAAAVRLLLSSQ